MYIYGIYLTYEEEKICRKFLQVSTNTPTKKYDNFFFVKKAYIFLADKSFYYPHKGFGHNNDLIEQVKYLIVILS